VANLSKDNNGGIIKIRNICRAKGANLLLMIFFGENIFVVRGAEKVESFLNYCK